MKKLSLILLTFLSLWSCDQDDENINSIYDPASGQTLIAFATSATSLPVLIDESATTEVTINVSSVFSTDRTLNLSVDNVNTTTAADNYILPSTVTLPANSNQITFEVQAIDNSIEVEPQQLVFNIVEDFNGRNTVYGNTTHTITFTQVCPVPEDYFVGTYLMEQLSGAAPFASVDPGFGTQTVEVVLGEESSAVRTVDFLYSPLNFETPQRLTFTLTCNSFNVSGENSSTATLGCDGGETSIGQSSPEILSTYDIDSGDDVFNILIQDFAPDGGCDVQSYEVELQFTKL